MATNEEHILAFVQRADALKADYMQSIRECVGKNKKTVSCDERQASVQAVHEAALKYFNAYDDFVGTSDLLGAHRSEQWVLGFADSCNTVLESVLSHYDFLGKKVRELGIESGRSSAFKPSTTAYASMQRLVARYCPKLVASLTAKFTDQGLPIYGFENPLPLRNEVEMADRRRTEKSETRAVESGTLIVFSILLLAVIGLTVLFASGYLRFGLQGFATYIVYVLAGLLAAVVCFKILDSTGELRGQPYGVTVKLGGAVVALAVVGAGGVGYERFRSTNPALTVRAFFYDIESNGAAGNIGTVWIRFGNERRSELVDSQGSVLFQGLPAGLLGQPVELQLESKTHVLDPANQVITAAENSPSKLRVRKLKTSWFVAPEPVRRRLDDNIYRVSTSHTEFEKLGSEGSTKDGHRDERRRQILRDSDAAVRALLNIDDASLPILNQLTKYEYAALGLIVSASVADDRNMVIGYSNAALDAIQEVQDTIGYAMEMVDDGSDGFAELKRYLRDNRCADRSQHYRAIATAINASVGGGKTSSDVSQLLQALNPKAFESDPIYHNAFIAKVMADAKATGKQN